MIVNRFPGICENCEEKVEVGDGFVHLIGDDWVCRCQRCTQFGAVERPQRTGKCKVCMTNKRAELINTEGVCVDCA